MTHHKDKQHKQQGNYHNLQSTKRTSKSHSKSQRRVRRQKQRAEGGGGGRKKKEKKRKENQTKKHHAHGETKSTNTGLDMHSGNLRGTDRKRTSNLTFHSPSHRNKGCEQVAEQKGGTGAAPTRHCSPPPKTANQPIKQRNKALQNPTVVTGQDKGHLSQTGEKRGCVHRQGHTCPPRASAAS